MYGLSTLTDYVFVVMEYVYRARYIDYCDGIRYNTVGNFLRVISMLVVLLFEDRSNVSKK